MTAMASLQPWVGREQVEQDMLAPWNARAMAAVLGTHMVATEGTPLPPLWHWLYFKPVVAPSELGEDGHPRKGGFLPPVELPRRMWAGSRLEWDSGNPLRLGQLACRTSRVESITHKTGRSGDLVFVTIRHQIGNEHGLAITETQDLVYRGELKDNITPAPPRAPPSDAAWSDPVLPDEAMLFRYSALTFNSHRIHYDQPYATGVEGYPGLVVHGPLLATLLLEPLRRERPGASLEAFEFRGVTPSFCGKPLRLCGSAEGASVRLWAHGDAGHLHMTATAQIQHDH